VRTPAGTETIDAGGRSCSASGGFEANPRCARAILGPNWELGPRARHPVQHRRRHQDGARDRRAAVGPLERLPLRAVGSERALAR
jgi:hypothetical protein